MTERLHFHFSLSCFGEGNGNPLQCSCLENPRDRGAWWEAVYGVTQSRTWLKWLSSSSSSNIPLGFPSGSVVKNAGIAGGAVSIPGLGRSPGGGHDNHSSFIAWRIPWTDEPGGLQRIQRVAKNWTWLKWPSMHAIFHYMHFNQYEVVPCCSFDLHFSNN